MENENGIHETPESIWHFLKKRTKEVHASLEKSGFMAGFVSKDLDLDQYKLLLLRLYQALAPTEAAIVRSKHLDTFSSVKDRPYLAALKADLAFFQIDTVFSGLAKQRYDFDTQPTLLGALYVLEGSALGGRQLARMIGSRLGLTPSTGMAYFSLQAALGMSRWTAFQSQVEIDFASEDYATCSEAALKIFQEFT